MISVLIPVYNAEYYINETLECMANQTYKDLEILICDDCSQDNSVSIINEFIKKNNNLNIKFFRNCENKGYLKTSNFLVSHANGEYISFQDADDLALPDRFMKLKKHLIDNKLDLVGSYCGIIRNREDVLSIIKYSGTFDEIKKDLMHKSHPPFCGSAILVKSSIIAQCGLYDVNFDRIGAEDYDWIYRVALEGFKLGNVSEPLYLYRQHNQSVSRLNFEKNKLALFSGLIAKDLYLSRLNNQGETFEMLKDRYLKEFEIDSDKLYYHVLRLNFLNSRKELFKSFCIFIGAVKFSRDKIIYTLYVFFILIFGFPVFEKMKNFLR